MSDTTQVAHICERVREYLERLPEDKWEAYHHRVANLIGFERKAECKNGLTAPDVAGV